MKNRCPWAGPEEIYKNYHDYEWGVPIFNDRLLFELLILEGAQAGLSWITVLKKRDAYRKAFDGFDPEKIAGYTSEDVKRLMGNPGIIRNRRKIEAAVTNARCYLELIENKGEFSKYIWDFVDGKSVNRGAASMGEIPEFSNEALMLSKELKKRGFKFVGPKIIYAFMQSAGLYNDHLVQCFRYEEILKINS